MDLPFIPVAFKQLFSKPSCEMYPEVAREAPVGYRGKISYNADLCLGCGMCQRVCADQAITMVKEEVEEGTKITLSFNLGSCTFCAHCQSFCSSGAIKLTQDYHMVATKEEDLIVSGSHIKPKKKSTGEGTSGKPKNDPTLCVYCSLCARKCPQEAITVNRAEIEWSLDESKCIGCGTCAAICPKKAIKL